MSVRIENTWVAVNTPVQLAIFPIDQLQLIRILKDANGAPVSAELSIRHVPTPIACSLADARELAKHKAGMWAST